MAQQDFPSATYRRLRRAIGYLGISLPIILILASAIRDYVGLQPSISHYYYTNLREIFTGILCAVGLFLVRYKGFGNAKWWLNDNLLTNIAGAAAFGVAFIPTNPIHATDKIYTLIPSDWKYLGWIHFGFAFVLFSIFALLSLGVFTIGQKRAPDLPVSMLNENNIYRVCGVLLIVFIVMIALSSTVMPGFRYSVLVFEALALFTFGTSWLIKGRALGDKGKVGQKLYGERN